MRSMRPDIPCLSMLPLGALAALAPVHAQEVEPAAEAAIQAVIADQMQAFREGDAAAAFAFASPMIQGMFGGDASRFGRMVASGYPPIWQPGAVTFLGQRQVEGQPVQRLMVAGPDGALHLFDYEMVEVEGGWRINGVFPVQGEAGA
ncbi:DUF4864 domain-containing protein [Frigidibacter oleivorans]|uniref:DUF4864 domain-containing protein n=1 Tax=Frigidibacter oleivorans TaxID=2487129 RepID=UPI001F2CB55F|nr:DUF4864 domain-containing protein [Frigidibacter oleivorans]